MKVSKTTWIGIACGLCCALCVGLYVAGVRSEVDEARAEALERYGGDQVEVCVAKRDLAAGEIVDESALETKLWVADLLPEGAITQASDIIGKRLGSSIIKGEVVCAGRTEASDEALTVPAGKAAVSVPAQTVHAVGGSLEPGMEVDVYATGASSTTRLVSSALVLATSTSSDSSSSTQAWITLAVDPEKVQELVKAAQTLDLSFVLPSDTGSSGSVGSEDTNGQELSEEEEEALVEQAIAETQGGSQAAAASNGGSQAAAASNGEAQEGAESHE